MIILADYDNLFKMNHQTEEMEAKMYYAISYKDPVSLQYLIDQGASVNRRYATL